MKTSIVRLPTVMARVGYSRSSIYLLVSKGKFPRPVALGDRAVGWIESEIDQWIDERIAQAQTRALVTASEAANEMGADLEELDKFIERGELPVVLIGKRKMIRRSALHDFKKRHADQFQASTVRGRA
jgi:prophage regulatory protein